MDQTAVVLLVVLAVVAIATFSVAIYLIVKLIKLWRVVHNDYMPLQGKAAFWVAAIYTVWPIDLLVDPVYLDDIGVLLASIAYIRKLAKDRGIIGADRTLGRSRQQPSSPGPIDS